jgi:hypothetical protein
VTPAAELDVPAQVREEKLEQKVVDFERLDEAGLKEGQWDVVFIACVCLLIHFFLLHLFPLRPFESDRVDRICSSLFVVRFADWARP